jgi:hypothetical protein
MKFQLQTDKNLFQFHIIYLGMNLLRKDAATRAIVGPTKWHLVAADALMAAPMCTVKLQ